MYVDIICMLHGQYGQYHLYITNGICHMRINKLESYTVKEKWDAEYILTFQVLNIKILF